MSPRLSYRQTLAGGPARWMNGAALEKATVEAAVAGASAIPLFPKNTEYENRWLASGLGRPVGAMLFTYGPFSREAAQDRSPWVERSGTLG